MMESRSVGWWTLLLLQGFGLPVVGGAGLVDGIGIFRHGWAGVRGGVSEDAMVRQVEAFSTWELPWSWRVAGVGRLESLFSGSVGWIGDARGDAPIATLGPGVRLSFDRIPVAVVGGSSPTLIGRNHFGGRDLGEAFQFTSHIGLAWRIADRVEFGYRFQHTSNAGLRAVNPGINFHMVGLCLRF